MERVKAIAYKNESKFKYLLLAGAGVGAFNTLCRPDFNLVVYLYAFYVWNNMGDSKETQANEKINSFFVLLYSLFIDFIWCFYWGSRWGSLKSDNEGVVHTIVLFTSWIAIGLKILVLLAIGIFEWSSIRSSLPSKLQERLNATQNFHEQKDDVQV